jgi:2-oxopent-4-enoate/cis-2-oxohex-4-enoate hydratase
MADYQALGRALYDALRSGQVIDPLTSADSSLTIEDAYHVSHAMLQLRLADGEVVIGKKIGVTSKAVQDMLGVHQPDFGYLTDVMQTGSDMPIGGALIQPKAEGEIAFVLASELKGPGVTMDDVLAATATVHPCFEVVDSRIRDWKVAIADTVADNASSGLFVIGEGVDPRGIDLAACELTVTKNGRFLSRGLGSAVQGSPLQAVAWLANTMGAFGVPLKAGEIILSGSLVPLEPVVPGDVMHAEITGLGSVEVRFT